MTIVSFVNNCAAVSSFAVKWNGGESSRTTVLMSGQNASIEMSDTSAPAGISCWARAYIQGGPNHDSGDNFTNGGPNLTYILSGSVDSPSFSMQWDKDFFSS